MDIYPILKTMLVDGKIIGMFIDHTFDIKLRYFVLLIS